MKSRPGASPYQMEMALMYVNAPPTYEWRPGTRNSGFFSSVGRGFRDIHWPMVKEHWAGYGDILRREERQVTPAEFAQMIEGREMSIPPSNLTQGQAERLIARHDREQREAQYQMNLRSAAGSLVGALPAWALSPEGIVGVAVPPLRREGIGAAMGATRSINAARQQPSVMHHALRRGVAEAPAAAAMGGTNIVAQQAAYGNVDALEATVAFAAPLVIGSGIGAYQGVKAASVNRHIGGAGGVDTPSPRLDAIDEEVPPRVVNEVRQTFGIVDGDTTPQAFTKIRETLQRNNLPEQMMEPLVEGFARLAERSGARLPESARLALARIKEIEALPVGRPSSVTTTRATQVSSELNQLAARKTELESRLVELDATPESGRLDEILFVQSNREEVASDLARVNREMAQLRQEQAALTARPDDNLVVPRAIEENARVKAAKRERATARGRETRLKSRIEEMEATVARLKKEDPSIDRSGMQRDVDNAKQNLAEVQAARKTAEDNFEAVSKEVGEMLQARASNQVDIPTRDNMLRTAMRDLADILARETDTPMPAEFLTELLENVAASRPVNPDSLRPTPRSTMEADDSASLISRTIDEEEMARLDPSFVALRRMPGGKEASEVFARQQQILKDCPV